MHEELKNQLREATRKSGSNRLDLTWLLNLIDKHYDRMDATINESLARSMPAIAPIEAIFDSVTDALLSVCDTGVIRSCNKVCSHYFDIDEDQLVGANIARFVPAAKDKPLLKFLAPFMSDLDDTGVTFNGGEVDVIRSDGETFVSEINVSCIDTAGNKTYVISLRDVSGRKREEEFALAQNQILEMIAAGKPFDRILNSICRCVESIDEGMHAAVMQLDIKNQVLSLVQAPGLEEKFRQLLAFVRVDEVSLTCGEAVFSTREKIVEDLSKEEGWTEAAAKATEQGIAACWSFPIYGAKGRIVGTLDVYLDKPNKPDADQLDKLSRMARLCGIAIKRELDEERLRNSESRYRGLFENVVDGVYIAATSSRPIRRWSRCWATTTWTI